MTTTRKAIRTVTATPMWERIQDNVHVPANLLNYLPNKEFFTTSEFAHKTGLSARTINSMCALGKLKAFQTGINASWLISVSELDRIRKEAENNLQSKLSTKALNRIKL